MNPHDHDAQLGTDQVPVRYSGKGRETIDKIRDAMTDEEFKAYCIGQMIRYRDRAGLKGSEEVDLKKAEFYDTMYRHLCNPEKYNDPRAYRTGFESYKRQPYDRKTHNIPEL